MAKLLSVFFVDEFMFDFPILRFLTKLRDGDSLVEMELQRAIMAKDDKYTARDNTSVLTTC